MKTLRMSSNWVDGDRFFDREAELQLLRERVEKRYAYAADRAAPDG